MILLSLDVETTGLDRENDEIIEVGAILYSTGQRRSLESAGYLVKPVNKTISKEITDLTGIHPAAVEKFGFSSQQGLENLLELAKQADAIIGQNIIRFDKPIIESWCRRERKPLIDKLFIDTRTDLPNTPGETLVLMCAKKGFLNLFPHSALSDCQSVLKLLEYENLDDVVKLAQSPIVILKGMHDRADNALAKKRKFAWNANRKIWWKTVKECQVDQEVSACSFNVTRVTDISVDELWYN